MLKTLLQRYLDGDLNDEGFIEQVYVRTDYSERVAALGKAYYDGCLTVRETAYGMAAELANA